MYKKIFRNMCGLSMITMLLAAVMIMSACYTSFNTKYAEELKNECAIIAGFADGDNPAAALDSASLDNDFNKRVTLISADGDILYTNTSDSDGFGIISENTAEIDAARLNGSAEWQRHTLLPFRQLYYYAQRLDGGSILCIATVADGMNSMFYTVLLAVIFVSALLYLLSVIVAFRLTENIINPIKNLRTDREINSDDVYDEIKPLLTRITKQNMEISRQMENVKTQKVRLQAIADNMNDGLVIVDEDGAVMSVNECATDIFGKTESEVKYRNVSLLTDIREITDCINKALRGEKSNTAVTVGDKTYQIFCSGMQRKQHTTGAVMLLFDVSDTAKAEVMRREFTANVSHELKTPLTSIHGYAQIINSGIAKPDDVGGFVAKIEKESSRLISLIDDIIRLSKLDEGGEERDRQNVDVRTVADDVAEQLSQKARARDISFEVSGSGCVVYMNPGQLAQLVYNLCDNAIKYNRDGGSVRVTVEDGVLTVADTGIGIPPEYTDRIFERFFRVDKSHSKKVDGTGLGLSIVKHIAHTNNIEITVDSVLGKGTEFSAKFGDMC